MTTKTLFDPERLLARSFASIHHGYTLKDVQLYALSVGFGCDATSAGDLPFVYEGVDGTALQPAPTFCNVLAYPGFWAREPDTGIDWKRVVHAEQHIVLHAPLPASGIAIGANRVSALWDRGAGRGTLMQQERTISDEAGVPLATVSQLSLLRGNGGSGSAGAGGAAPVPYTMPGRAPDAACDHVVPVQAALLYRLNGDLNPLHADPAVAKTAGFDRPILHGMATMGIAARAVLQQALAYDAARFAAMRVRFTAPALPGDTLRTELWMDGAAVSLRTTALERNTIVLDNSYVEIR